MKYSPRPQEAHSQWGRYTGKKLLKYNKTILVISEKLLWECRQETIWEADGMNLEGQESKYEQKRESVKEQDVC